MNKKVVKYYEEILNDLLKDVAFIQHRKSLDDISKALFRACKNERKWANKCKKLKLEIVANASKVKTALSIADQDKNTINTLTNELNNAWKCIDELKVSKSKNGGRSNNVATQTISLCNKDFISCFETKGGSITQKYIDELKDEIKMSLERLDSTENENVKLKKDLKELMRSKEALRKKEDLPTDKPKTRDEQMLENKITFLEKKLFDSLKLKEAAEMSLKQVLKLNEVLSEELAVNKNKVMRIMSELELAKKRGQRKSQVENINLKQEKVIHDLEMTRNHHMKTIRCLEQEIFELKLDLKRPTLSK